MSCYNHHCRSLLAAEEPSERKQSHSPASRSCSSTPGTAAATAGASRLFSLCHVVCSYLAHRISLKCSLTSASRGLIPKNQDDLYLPLTGEDVKALPGQVLPSGTSGATWEHTSTLSDLIRTGGTKICKICKRSRTGAGTELDGVYLTPPLAAKARISKLIPQTSPSELENQTERTQAPYPQFTKSPCVFKTTLFRVAFQSHTQAGVSSPLD